MGYVRHLSNLLPLCTRYVVWPARPGCASPLPSFAVRMSGKIDVKALLGLTGVLLTAMGGEFNGQVTSSALVDILGGLSLGHDEGTWISSLYTSGEVIGMIVAPWCSVTFSSRLFLMFVIALNLVTSALIPTTHMLAFIYPLRTLQGLSDGLAIPLLMSNALRVLSPPIRLYGLAVYALTATFAPNFATTLAALWVDLVGWRFVFLQAIPILVLAAALILYGMPQDPLRLERLKIADWQGLVCAIIGLGSLSTLLQQGDRLDWFNSPTICVLALLSVIFVPLLLINEWAHELPMIRIQLLGRRNLTYGLIALFLFLLIGLAAGQLPLTYLTEVQTYRPIQAYPISLMVALGEIVMLPVIAKLLDYEWADSRAVTLVGLVLILIACIGSSLLDVTWQRDQFSLWQTLQAIGQPMVVMPLLLMATNSLSPEEGPLASGLFNTPRALAEATGVWMIQLLDRWRGALHSNRIYDLAGQMRFSVLQAAPLDPRHPPPYMPNGMPGSDGGVEAFAREVHAQVVVLTLSDTYLVIAALVVVLMVVVCTVPERTMPPRIQLAQQ